MGVVVATLVLQVALPDDMELRPWWLLPAVSVLLVVALLLVNPGRMSHFSAVERVISLLLVAAVTAVNAGSAATLVYRIAAGTIGDHAGAVLVTGGSGFFGEHVARSVLCLGS